jgi:hypothetical protein
MEKLTAEIIKDQLIGETNGHMATVPNNPIIFSLYSVWYAQNGQNKNWNDAFASFLKEVAQGLEND